MKEMEKTSNESAAFPADGDAPVISSPRRKKNRVLHLLSEMWPAYLIEVMVIIVGISITLVLEEWRDNSKEEKLAEVYLGNLAADIDTDRQSLHYAISSTDSLLARGDEVRQFLKDPDGHALTAARLNEDVRKLINRPNFLSHDATFSDLKSSGNLHLIKDIRLKGLLFAYYSKAENTKWIQDAEQQATIELSGRYFLQWFAVDGSDDSPIFHSSGGVRALTSNTEFRNHVAVRVGTRKELLPLYKETDSLAARLLELLPRKGS